MNNMFNRIPPFKWFVLQNFPFIEEDFDAITNYQLLCKIVEYLNTTIDKTNELGNQVEVLTNWFNNLDVQDEIDNKLDTMAQDGTLARIINENIFQELNTKINTLEQTTSENFENVGNQIEQTNSNLQETNTDLQNLKNAQNPIDFYKGKNLVVFGDSYSQPDIPNSEDEYWVKQVVQATGMTRFNFAIAGAGFGRSTNLLATQLTTAQNQMTAEQKQNTSVVIVYAGYNDLLNEVTDEEILSNYIALITNIATTFPKAKIIVAPFNWGYGSLSRDINLRIETLMVRMERDTSQYPVTFLKLARYWLIGVNTNFRNSNHPSVNGYKIIASYMIGAIYGSSEHVHLGGYVTPSHGNQNISDFTFEDGMVNFNFGTKFDDDLNDYSGTQFEDLHALLVPETDMIIPLYSIATGYCGTLRLANDGKGYLRNITVPADTWIVANVSFRPQAWKVWT